jgi:hypothetical protein
MLLASKREDIERPGRQSSQLHACVEYLEGLPARRSDLWWVYTVKDSYELTLPSISVFPILHRPFFTLLRFAGPSSTVANQTGALDNHRDTLRLEYI